MFFLESCEMHPEDDKALSEKNKKRIVKTHAQVQALEKFYNGKLAVLIDLVLQFICVIVLTMMLVFFFTRTQIPFRINENATCGVNRADREAGFWMVLP